MAVGNAGPRVGELQCSALLLFMVAECGIFLF